jgi:hypothetical protein
MVKPHDCIILDDLMEESKTFTPISNLFTRMVHHLPCFVINITQNLFQSGKETRTRSLNTQYLILFKNPRDASQVSHLGRQMFPGEPKFLTAVFNSIIHENPYAYLFLDLHQTTPDYLRVRCNFLPFEEPHYTYQTTTYKQKTEGKVAAKRFKMTTESQDSPYSRMILISEADFNTIKKRLIVDDSLFQADLTPDQAVKVYAHNRLQNKRKMYTMEETTQTLPSPSPPLKSEALVSSISQTENTVSDEQLKQSIILAINTFPKYCRAKGRVLLELLTAHKPLPWNDKGQILDDNNQPIVNSHILDLIRYTADARIKVGPPVGWIQMKKILQELNIPNQYTRKIDEEKIVPEALPLPPSPPPSPPPLPTPPSPIITTTAQPKRKKPMKATQTEFSLMPGRRLTDSEWFNTF